MVDCLADLILRPGETGLPPVQAQLTVVAGVDTLRGGDEPGEIDGHPVPAAVVRELAYALGLLPRPDTPGPGRGRRAGHSRRSEPTRATGRLRRDQHGASGPAAPVGRPDPAAESPGR